MRAPDDYEDDMFTNRFSEEDIERLFSGGDFDDSSLQDLAEHLHAARASWLQAPDEASRARHLAALAEAIEARRETQPPAELGTERRPNWRRVIVRSRSFVLRLAAATMAGGLSLTGLAYAGVNLPGSAAEQALENVLGVELPNQGDETEEIELVQDELETEDAHEGDGPDESAADVAHEIWNYISTTTDTGCTFGQNVAAIASGGDETPDTDPCAAGSDGETASEARGSEATGAEASEAGADNAGTSDDEGRAKADEASGGADSADSGEDDEGDEGSSASEEGQSKNPTGKGRP